MVDLYKEMIKKNYILTQFVKLIDNLEQMITKIGASIIIILNSMIYLDITYN